MNIVSKCMGRITTVDQKQIFDFPIDIIVAYYSVIGNNDIAPHCNNILVFGCKFEYRKTIYSKFFYLNLVFYLEPSQ